MPELAGLSAEERERALRRFVCWRRTAIAAPGQALECVGI
jgi:hypothetical protein